MATPQLHHHPGRDLLTVFGKNKKANLTQAERNALAALTRVLGDSLKRTV